MVSFSGEPTFYFDIFELVRLPTNTSTYETETKIKNFYDMKYIPSLHSTQSEYASHGM